MVGALLAPINLYATEVSIMANQPTNRAAVEDCVHKGDKVRAIQEYVRQTRAGLKDSKDAVDKMFEELKKQK
jgi:ribosomal protein L7/L12